MYSTDVWTAYVITILNDLVGKKASLIMHEQVFSEGTDVCWDHFLKIGVLIDYDLDCIMQSIIFTLEFFT